MYWADGTESPETATWKDASTGAIFNYDKWEPGYVEVRHVKIANEGTLAFKYKVEITANGTVSDLANVIDVYYVDPAVQVADRTELVDAYKLGTLAQVLTGLADSGNGTLLAGKDDTITLALKMQETAGNDYQDKEIGSDFTVQVYAAQLASEKDSFGDQYDKDATYIPPVTEAATFMSLLNRKQSPITVGADLDLTAQTTSGAINYDVELDLGGNTINASTFGKITDGLKVSNGKVATNKSLISAYLDLRPQQDENYYFEDMTFENTYRKTTSNNSGTNRVQSMVKLTADVVADTNVTLVFKDCVFNNASVYVSGQSSGKNLVVDVKFINCTFNAMTNTSGLIEFSNYMTGNVTIENCIFNIEATKEEIQVLKVSNSSSTQLTVTATDTKINANLATAYTHNPELGETAVDNVGIDYYARNGAKVRLFDYSYLPGGYSTVTETNTMLSGNAAVESRR